MKKLLLITPLLLGGCSAFNDARPQPITYPESLFICPDKPDPSTIVTDNDLGEFIVRQDAVITICKEKLHNVGELIKKNQPK